MIRSKFNEKEEVLEVFYEGVIGVKDFIEFGNSIRYNKSYPRKLNILIDATTAEYILNFEDINYLGKTIQKDIESYTMVRSAMIHSMPKETALSMIFENNQKIPKYTRKIFSTRQAALEWLMFEQ